MALAFSRCSVLVLSISVIERLKATLSFDKMPSTNSCADNCILRCVTIFAIAVALKLFGCGIPAFSCKALLMGCLGFKAKSFG